MPENCYRNGFVCPSCPSGGVAHCSFETENGRNCNLYPNSEGYKEVDLGEVNKKLDDALKHIRETKVEKEIPGCFGTMRLCSAKECWCHKECGKVHSHTASPEVLRRPFTI